MMVKNIRRSVECTKRYTYSRENTYVKKYFENFTNVLQFLTICNNFNESHRIRSIYSLQTIQRLLGWFKLNILTTMVHLSVTVKSVNRPQIIDLNDILLDP